MNPTNLSPTVKEIISGTDHYDEMLLSAISPWEFCKLLEKNRLGISGHPEEWLNVALNMPKFRLVELSPLISYRSTCLPQPFHKDPGDQIIAATARTENATILTRDERLLQYQHVKAVW